MQASAFATPFDFAEFDTFTQEVSDASYLKIPSFGLDGFTNTDTSLQVLRNGQSTYVMNGHIDLLEPSRICPECGRIMHVHGSNHVNLFHLPFGGTSTKLHFSSDRFFCPCCHHSEMQTVPFKSDEHRITKPLQTYIESLLALNRYTLKDISVMTGVNRDIIKDIDKNRLLDLYTTEENGVRVLRRVEEPVPFLGIDEFLLHKGNKYVTHIIDQQSGAILWIAVGKKKQIVYDFIAHYGLEWMQGVQADAGGSGCCLRYEFRFRRSFP